MTGDIPKTWEDALAAWDACEPVFTIELGGLGPSYEQAMHIAIFETLRLIGNMSPEALKRDTRLVVIDKAVANAEKERHLQLTMGQAGQVRTFVHGVLMQGWQNYVTKYETDRRIQVCRWWPGKE
jgi:hypothetical protein